MRELVRAILDGDVAAVRALADARATAKSEWFEELGHYLYAGDTAMHVAAAAHRFAIVRALPRARVHAVNRRKQTPLHYACDGGPNASDWDPRAQARTIAALIAAGADVDALDASGVAPLHRAVRTRCAAAVRALLDGGADRTLRNGAGSLPIDLAGWTTGRGGSGKPEAKAQAAEIVAMLTPSSASRARARRRP